METKELAIRWVLRAFEQMKSGKLSVAERLEERRKLSEDDQYLASWAKTTGFKEELVYFPENFYFDSQGIAYIDHPISGEIGLECVATREEDYGVGAYEFWGFRGYHEDVVKVVTEVELFYYEEDLVSEEDIKFLEWMYNEYIDYCQITIQD